MAGDVTAFTGKAPAGGEKFKVGFSVFEIPLGLVRNMDKAGQVKEGSETRKMLDALFLEDDDVGISVNDFDASMTPMKNPDGSYKKLVNKAFVNPEQK